MTFWETVGLNLSRPEYVHVLINPMPVYGLTAAIVALTIALVLRKRVALVIALCLVLLASLSAWPNLL